MSNHGLHTRSLLVRHAERKLHREPLPNRGDYLIAAVGIVGCAVIVILTASGIV